MNRAILPCPLFRDDPRKLADEAEQWGPTATEPHGTLLILRLVEAVRILLNTSEGWMRAEEARRDRAAAISQWKKANDNILALVAALRTCMAALEVEEYPYQAAAYEQAQDTLAKVGI